ncbi:MAG: hypothetical protein ACX93O_04045 [Flagellimonas sp.]
MGQPGIYIIFLLISKIAFGQSYPQAQISNEVMDVLIYLPDKENGYYRATRFDWAGLIPELNYKGHSFFGQWFKDYDPKVHESVMGPVDEFDPLGYDQANSGATFVKIGVGSLVKPTEWKYSPYKTYQIRDFGKRNLSIKSNQITFKHKLKNSPYAYKYKKTISLTKGKPEMTIKYELVNIGERTIDTEVYNHNFFYIDKLNIGPGYVVAFPAEIKSNSPQNKGIGTLAEITENRIQFLKKLEGKEQVFLKEIHGSQKDPQQYKITIENKNSGAGVRITGDKPLSKLTFWSSKKTICPEPYIHIKVEPGNSFSFKIHYEFYTF